MYIVLLEYILFCIFVLYIHSEVYFNLQGNKVCSFVLFIFLSNQIIVEEKIKELQQIH